MDDGPQNQSNKESQSFVAVCFEYDDASRILKAHLSDSSEPQDNSMGALKAMLNQPSYHGMNVPTSLMETLLQKIDAKALGTIELYKKPEYTSVELIFEEASQELYALLTLAEEKKSLSKMDLQRMLDENRYSDFAFEDNAIANLLKKIENNERGQFLLAKRLDANVKITVSQDNMHAFMTVIPARGGKPLTQSDLIAKIKAAKISPKRCDEGVLFEVLKTQSIIDGCFAKGIAPQKGEDALFEALVTSTVESGPRIDEYDRAHFKDIKEFTIVDVGRPLMRRTPATLGKPGVNVFGELIEATPGTDLPFFTENTGSQVCEKDKNLLIASMRGSPTVLPTGVKIDNVIKFQDIDLNTGNVRVDASIEIEGNVHQGMVVVATGSVFIKGSVRNAVVMSGEDIHVGEGIIGSNITEEDDGSHATARLIAKRNIYANYVTLAKLTAEKDIIINNYVSTSDLEAKGRVVVGQEGGKGKIMGGRTNAESGICANILGGRSGVITKITAGLPLKVKARLKLYLNEQERIQKNITQLTFLIESKQKDHEQTGQDHLLAQITEIQIEIKRLGLELKRVTGELSAIESELLTMRNANVNVKKHIHENTILNINGVKLPIQEEMQGEFTFIRKGKSIQQK